ncbi:hypothetical protein CHS0354_034865 [Potamilus streckersoni]|uniref:Ubiquitin-protein ligase E3A n=1 Tax=Potamilus streckersoni TaxID=2493646 RepID=A0AAE0TK26_9BIVA|nr:hypothetical protein CHS0354_034865 [Potamilus streckersoni]
MNSNGKQDTESGAEAARKRAAAKMIEAYFMQLTVGCGQPECNNEMCASSSQFCLRDKDKNTLAVHALNLLKTKAPLCEGQKCKMAKTLEDDDHTNAVIARTSPVASSSKFPDVPFNQTLFPSNMPIGTPAKEQSPTAEVKFLTEEILEEIISSCEAKNDWSNLIKIIGSVFSNPDSLSMSFRKKPGLGLSKEELRSMGNDDDKDVDEKEDEESGETIQSSNQEIRYRNYLLTEEISVDVPSLKRAYTALSEIQGHPFQNALINALQALSRTVNIELKYEKPLEQNPNYVNIFIIVMEIPFLQSPEYIENAFPEFCKAFTNLPMEGRVKLAKVWSKFGVDHVSELVQSLQQLITVKLIDNETRWSHGYFINDEEHITGPTRVMKILYYASLYGGKREQPEVMDTESESVEMVQEMIGAAAMGFESKESRQQKEDPLGKELGVSHLDCKEPLVPYEDFVNETLNEYIHIETDYKYNIENNSKFSFVDHHFILTTASKHTSMYLDNRVRMFEQRISMAAMLQSLIHRIPPMPFLRIRVRRDHIIDDSLVALEMVATENPQDLKKQLFVEFDGEQGLDEGGVSKEFFQLIVDEIFNPDFGMFTYNESTKLVWFNPTSFENDGQFTLIGIVLGLAIYNSTIVDVHFPSVVYRKLMGKKGVLDDLPGYDPVLSQSLQQMLQYTEPDFEDVFLHTFCISYMDVFGNTLTHELKENGSQIPVTQQNKQDFVRLYADFLLNKSINKQFRAFKKGFDMVINESPLKTLFRPSEIELLICGSKNLDFIELEKATEYDGGFDINSRTIRNFWNVVHSFTEEQKRKLLQFTTGTDRVPVGGLAKLKLIIARNGPDSDRLPTAHTCFNVLLLPDYETKEKLEERLLKAINYSKGFGML